MVVIFKNVYGWLIMKIKNNLNIEYDFDYLDV